MRKPEKTLILLALSWLGTGLLLIAGLIRLPTFLEEREKLIGLKNAISDRKSIEMRLKTFVEDFRNETGLLKAEISRREKQIAERSFKCLNEEQIPDFINELQLIFAENDVAIINLGYEKRKTIGNFVLLPFSAEFRADYQGMRKLLHAMETHPAGIIIDKLDFISLNDADHKIRLKTDCSLRFRKIGQ